MTFNRSCSYAGLANLLEDFEIHLEDYEIAKELSLPYLFQYHEKFQRYVAGPMIQSAPWFNYFLNSKGLDLIEGTYGKDEVLALLDEGAHRYMVSLKFNDHGKHAIIYEGKENDYYRFLNNKRIDSSEPDYYVLSREEVRQRLDELSLMGYMEKINTIIPLDLTEALNSSVQHFKDYASQLKEFCLTRQSVEALAEAKQRLFAPLMLDILSMLEIIEEDELVKDLKTIRTHYMKLMKENRPLILAEEFSMQQLDDVLSRYQKLLEQYAHNYINH